MNNSCYYLYVIINFVFFYLFYVNEVVCCYKRII